MRASSGSSAASRREGKARVSLAGRLRHRTRPVDLFIEGLAHLAQYRDRWRLRQRHRTGRAGSSCALRVPEGFRRRDACAVMAGTLATHDRARQCRSEPESSTLPNAERHGREDQRAGTEHRHHEGVRSLRAARHRVLAPIGIETGNLCMAVAWRAATSFRGHRASLLGHGARGDPSPAPRSAERTTGIRHSSRNGAGIKPVDIVTDPFPGFTHRPPGAVHGTDDPVERRFPHYETIFENVHACAGAGAARRQDLAPRPDGQGRGRVAAEGCTGDGDGSQGLSFARHRGPGGRGRDHVSRVYHLDRGFERLEEKLTRCGAHVERVSDCPARRVRSGAQSAVALSVTSRARAVAVSAQRPMSLTITR